MRANLDFVRNQVQGPTMRESRWQDWLGTLTLNEWTLLAAGAFWLTFILFAARQIRPALAPEAARPDLRRVASLTILFCAGAGLAGGDDSFFKTNRRGRCSRRRRRAAGRLTRRRTRSQAHDGAELAVLDRHDDWVQVADGSGKNRLVAGEAG